MNHIYDRINKICERLWQLSCRHETDIQGFYYKVCDYKTDNKIPVPDETWNVFENGMRWGGVIDSHCHFYKKITIPVEMKGQDVVFKLLTGREAYGDATNPQFIVYVDGNMVQGMDVNHTEVLLTGKDEYELYLYAYSGMIDNLIDFHPVLRIVDKDIEKLYYDLKVPLGVAEYTDENSSEYIDLINHLNKAINYLDLRIPYSPEFFNSVAKATEYMEKEFYNKYCRTSDKSTICIGHTHIDVAWLWTLAQTREKVQRSFATVVALMKQYPEYKFMSSQAKLYAYLKEEAPELYEEIKDLVAQGRWEVEGAMWLEADCNLPSGESLVRQILYGKRFFKEEFGVDSRILWLPDVFGYSAAMPQILKKSGVDVFVTSKISWNDFNEMPHDTFEWQGIDGTKILSYFLTAQDRIKGMGTRRYATYNADITPAMVAGTWDRYHEKNINNEVLLTFGHGDGGGGPKAEMLENARRLKYGIPGCPDAKIDTVTNFFKRLNEKLKDNSRLPSWNGELYLEFHRGTYTSIAKNKKNNRKCEFLFQNAEWLAMMAQLLYNDTYPAKTFFDCWEKILTRQFHDIIPGSSIGEVYDECDKTYAEVQKTGNQIVDNYMYEISKKINSDGGVLVFNPTSFCLSGIAETSEGPIYVNDIPSKGYKVVALPAEDSSNCKVCLTSDYSIENKFFKIKFDKELHITSLYDKRCCREVIQKGKRANVLQVFEDIPYSDFDAWDICEYYNEKMWEINNVSSVNEIDIKVGRGIEVTRKYLNSTVKQQIVLYDEVDRIDFKTNIGWHEEHMLLKAAFPVEIHADKATYDVQFGTVERPTHKNTSWDEAKFEVCAHKFADVSEHGYGVSLLNDCKYGYDIDGSVMRLSLLRCPTWPYKDADKGNHDFVYSLYPHKGNWREADTVKHAFELNNPMRGVLVSKQEGILPECFSVIKTDHENLIVDSIKKAENSSDMIIRMYECNNMRMRAKVTLGFQPVKIMLCDLLENEISEITTQKQTFDIDVKPYEIITLKVSCI